VRPADGSGLRNRDKRNKAWSACDLQMVLELAQT